LAGSRFPADLQHIGTEQPGFSTCFSHAFSSAAWVRSFSWS
jgi:hypothetical protein